MKRIYLLLFMAFGMGTLSIVHFPLSISEALAQDSRNRVASTIIADGLAQLPAQNLETLEQVMSEIAGTGAEGVQSLAAMLGPSAEGKNATFQYAIDGLTSYVTQKGREAQCAAVKKGLEAALARCTDEGNKVFLQDQLNKLTPGSVEVKHAVEDLSTIAANSRAIAEFRDKVGSLPAKKVAPFLLKTLKKSGDRQLRNTALELGGAALAPLAVKAFPKLKADAQTDVVRWLGNRHDTENVEAVFRALGSSNDQLANAAIEAAGKIGGVNALSSLINALNGNHAAAAAAALSTFNGNVADGVLSALKGQGSNAAPALVALAGERHITAAYEPLTALIGNDKLHATAAKSLAQIVTNDNFADLLSRFQPYPELFYNLLAQRGNKDDIKTIATAAAQSTDARAALLKVNSSDAVAPLMSLAATDAAGRDALLGRALTLIQGANWPRIDKYQLIKQALELKPSAATANNLVTALGTLNNEPALNLAAQYMNVKENDLAAAHAVTDLIEKNEALQRGAHIRDMLLKAQNVFKSHTENADAGYAVDQVNTILPKIVDDPNAVTAKVSKLSKEEEKAGYELLFDGTNLDQWHGGKANYVPIDGAIYVSANYGAEGNLYTNRKYSDFVFRFEFCFVRPGINNGVGIRTKDGVDAAYDGMEIQILDHDDPIYQGLREYQVHGSVYGIIPAKRIKHKPLGEWNYEEIRAVGDHITVTLNGEVLVDGDIRKACQGHNMAPEEGKANPYTVDHQSHPGLFNKDGFISFCGHGEGLKLRNIRVLDLSKQKKGKATTKRRK
ncbi:MAG: DUF1080 domain-containing protein [Bacteroidaceae bacterium]|nr:DUF1080 domain-containing protein [Bacteroidaceae bacterium]